MSFLKQLLFGRARDRKEDASVANMHGVRDVLQKLDALRADGNRAAALSEVSAALARNPGVREFLLAKSDLLFSQERFREALRGYLDAVSRGAGGGELFVRVGWTQLHCADAAAAETWMRKAIAEDAAEPTAPFGLGVALNVQKRPAEAAAMFQRALDLRGSETDCLVELGNCCLAQNDFEGAERYFRLALRTDEKNAMAWGLLGVALDRLSRSDEALAATKRSVALDDESGEASDRRVNLAAEVEDAGEGDQAIRIFEGFLAERQTLHGYTGYATALLTAGRWQEGWQYYQFRFMIEPQLSLHPPFTRPWWNGQDLRGKTILLHVEQGLGDVLQFVRYAPFVKALGAQVFIVVSKALLPLARGFHGIDRVLGPGEASPDFSYYVHLLSLPRIFGTTVDTVPANVPYVTADPARCLEAIAAVAREGGSDLKVGIVWTGSAAIVYNARRAVPIPVLAPLFDIPGIRWFSLQRGGDTVAADDARHIERLASVELRNDLEGTAALLASLDLLLTVDTGLAHLAGALGKPVWLMLPNNAHWVWLEGREDSPWYPAMRLFRQQQRGEWTDVIARVKEALETAVASGGASTLSAPVEPRTDTLSMTPRDVLPREAPGHRRGFSAVAETRHGIMQYLPDEPDVGDGLGWYGEWLEAQLELLGRLIGPGATLLEVGSGVGAHAIALGRKAGAEGHLLVVEQRLAVQRILRNNLTANRAGNVTLLRDAAGWADGGAGNVDGLWLERLDWLKVSDAEASATVLAGAEATLWRLRPGLFLSVSDAAAMARLAHTANEHGYRCWRHEAALFNRENFNRRTADIFDGRAALALVAIPEELDARMELPDCVELS